MGCIEADDFETLLFLPVLAFDLGFCPSSTCTVIGLYFRALEISLEVFDATVLV